MSPVSILIIDQNSATRRKLHAQLYAAGFDVTDVVGTEQALGLNRVVHFDATLLIASKDQPPPVKLSRLLRSELPNTAILVISDADDWHRRVQLLDAGADECLAKPFSSEELIARIRAIVRRSRPLADGSGEVIAIGDIVLDTGRRLVFKAGHLIQLTPKEYDLLHYLMKRAGFPATHAAMLNAVWGAEYMDRVPYLRTFMRQLRKKLDSNEHPQYLLTDCYIGYRFVEPESAPVPVSRQNSHC
jgi:two-component system KDP operon response regulator KdpE